jgi:hypothetical protein
MGRVADEVEQAAADRSADHAAGFIRAAGASTLQWPVAGDLVGPGCAYLPAAGTLPTTPAT